MCDLWFKSLPLYKIPSFPLNAPYFTPWMKLMTTFKVEQTEIWTRLMINLKRQMSVVFCFMNGLFYFSVNTNKCFFSGIVILLLFVNRDFQHKQFGVTRKKAFQSSRTVMLIIYSTIFKTCHLRNKQCESAIASSCKVVLFSCVSWKEGESF